jgi:hypothetical protein
MNILIYMPIWFDFDVLNSDLEMHELCMNVEMCSHEK